jgi:hemerythrin superfamily protein
MNMPVATPEQINRVLEAVEYPADRDAILAQARRRRAGQAVRSTLEQLPTKSYDSPATARQQLERIEPALKEPAKQTPKRKTRSTKSGTSRAQAEQEQLTLPEPVRQAAETVRVRGGRAIGEAGSRLADQADRGRETAARSMKSTAESIRQAGQRLQRENQPPAARMVTFAADQLDAGAGYLQRTDVRKMIRQAEGVAQRQPWLVLGVGAAVGFLATRLMRNTDMRQLTEAGGGSQPTKQAEGSGRSAGANSADAIGLLESDHKTIRLLLRRGGSAAIAKRWDAVSELKRQLQSHERMEEEIFYPALKENPATRQLVIDNYAEHQVVDEILGEIEATDPSDAEWTNRFAAMRANLEHHAEEEETDLFPVARKAFTQGELRELGTRMSEIKELASQGVTA